MCSSHWRSGGRLVMVATGMFAALAGCGPARYAYFQPRTNALYRATTLVGNRNASVDTLPAPVISPTPLADTAAPSASSVEDLRTVKPTAPIKASASRVVLHRNPDSYQNQRFNRLFRSEFIAHVAPQSQLIDRHSHSRKVPWLTWAALGLAAVAYAPILVIEVGTMPWALTLLLPLSALMLGTASLSLIKRHKDRYRGKGWAMAAIMLSTGMLGMALVAVAALSGSGQTKK